MKIKKWELAGGSVGFLVGILLTPWFLGGFDALGITVGSFIGGIIGIAAGAWLEKQWKMRKGRRADSNAS